MKKHGKENVLHERHDTTPPLHRNWFDKLKQLFGRTSFEKKDLLHKLRDAEAHGIFDQEVLHIIEGALQVSDMQVRDIMIPRSQMVCISATEVPKNFLPKIIASGHSRYPVIGESTDDIMGILLAKDLLPLLFQDNVIQSFSFDAITRAATFVPESKRLTTLLHDFQTNRNHMAIVVDEYGGISGLITIEDVLEEIVGEIEDEYDEKSENLIKAVDNDAFIVKAFTPIEDFNEFFQATLNEEEVDTIGGLIMQRLGYMPKLNESIEIENFHFKVTSADGRRIRILHVKPKLTTQKSALTKEES